MNSIDQLLILCEQVLSTLWGTPSNNTRPDPSAHLPEAMLSREERRHSGRLMRVNHTGEICAQALYHGQASTAKTVKTRQLMEQAAREENDHLAWCHTRLNALGAHPSLLNPLWYGLSFSLGAAASAAGDHWSLGFVVETERQVVDHLTKHLVELPENDKKSAAILTQMRTEEAEHAHTAYSNGARPLPRVLRWLMRQSSRIMTTTAYWI